MQSAPPPPRDPFFLSAGRSTKAAHHLIPRGAERTADAADHIDARIRRARLDPLHITPIYFGELREIILSQSALRPQAVDVLAKDGAR